VEVAERVPRRSKSGSLVGKRGIGTWPCRLYVLTTLRVIPNVHANNSPRTFVRLKKTKAIDQLTPFRTALEFRIGPSWTQFDDIEIGVTLSYSK